MKEVYVLKDHGLNCIVGVYTDKSFADEQCKKISESVPSGIFEVETHEINTRN